MRRLSLLLVIVFVVLPFLSCVGFNPTGHPISSPPPATPVTPTTPTTSQSPGCITGTVWDPTESMAIAQRVRVTLEAAYVENNVTKFDIIGYPLAPSSDGTFNLCYPAGPTNGARYMVVVSARTDYGVQFAPVIIPSVEPNTALGPIPLGGLTAPQSAASARIDVSLTSAPVAVSGAIYLDGIASDPLIPGGILHYAIPVDTSAEGRLYFTTASGGTCGSTPCAQASLPVPALPPVFKSAAGYSPASAIATYTIRAGTFSGSPFPISSTCNWAETALDTNGLPLTATPGAVLTASPLAFTGC